MTFAMDFMTARRDALLDAPAFREAVFWASEYGLGDPVSERCGIIGHRAGTSPVLVESEMAFAAIENKALTVGAEFHMSNEDIVQAMERMEFDVIVSWWHSHPSGSGPSTTDWNQLTTVGRLYGCTTGVVTGARGGRYAGGHLYMVNMATGQMLTRELAAW